MFSIWKKGLMSKDGRTFELVELPMAKSGATSDMMNESRLRLISDTLLRFKQQRVGDSCL